MTCTLKVAEIYPSPLHEGHVQKGYNPMMEGEDAFLHQNYPLVAEHHPLVEILAKLYHVVEIWLGKVFVDLLLVWPTGEVDHDSVGVLVVVSKCQAAMVGILITQVQLDM